MPGGRGRDEGASRETPIEATDGRRAVLFFFSELRTRVEWPLNVSSGCPAGQLAADDRRRQGRPRGSFSVRFGSVGSTVDRLSASPHSSSNNQPRKRNVIRCRCLPRYSAASGGRCCALIYPNGMSGCSSHLVAPFCSVRQRQAKWCVGDGLGSCGGRDGWRYLGEGPAKCLLGTPWLPPLASR